MSRIRNPDKIKEKRAEATVSKYRSKASAQAFARATSKFEAKIDGTMLDHDQDAILKATYGAFAKKLTKKPASKSKDPKKKKK